MAIRRISILVLFCLLLFVSACASSETDDELATSDVAVVDARFDGDFTVSQMKLGGTEVELLSAPNITIESIFGGLTVKPGCNTYFGSLSLGESGEASFTIAGGSQETCPGLADQERTLLEVLDQVDGWEEQGDGFRLFNASGTELILVR